MLLRHAPGLGIIALGRWPDCHSERAAASRGILGLRGREPSTGTPRIPRLRAFGAPLGMTVRLFCGSSAQSQSPPARSDDASAPSALKRSIVVLDFSPQS